MTLTEEPSNIITLAEGTTPKIENVPTSIEKDIQESSQAEIEELLEPIGPITIKSIILNTCSRTMVLMLT